VSGYRNGTKYVSDANAILKHSTPQIEFPGTRMSGKWPRLIRIRQKTGSAPRIHWPFPLPGRRSGGNGSKISLIFSASTKS
jgi:hypothetical protein